MANEACFIWHRSLLHFFCAKNRVCGLTICDLTILVDHFKRLVAYDFHSLVSLLYDVYSFLQILDATTIYIIVFCFFIVE